MIKIIGPAGGCLRQSQLPISRFISIEKEHPKSLKQLKGYPFSFYIVFVNCPKKSYCQAVAFSPSALIWLFSFTSWRAKKFARIAPDTLCHTLNTAPGIVASGY